MSKTLKVILFLLFIFIFPQPTYAHAFGQSYTLPLPVWLYLWGGSAAVIVSFFLIALFSKSNGHKNKQSLIYFRIPNLEIINFLTIIVRAIVAFMFILVVVAGLFGSQSPNESIVPVLFWIIFYLGTTYLSIIFGNFFENINPFISFAKILSFKEKIKYPQKLSYIPALLYFFFIIWLELASNGLGVKPRFLAELLIAYAVTTVGGSFVFGYKNWFKYADFFTVFFSTISKISPLKIKDNKIQLKFQMTDEAKNISLLFLIMFALSSTAFDGFRQTKTWVIFFGGLEYLISSVFKIIPQTNAIETVALLISPLVFLYLYLLAIYFMKILFRTNYSVMDLALKFSFSLIPIAAAYNIAHYFTLLFIQGQSIISQISDPFNLGWNIFGTINYKVNIALLGASTIWNVEVAVIIIGHIAAVYFAHLKAQEIYMQNKKAIMSQIPMLLLMISYTMLGLWILSQPLTLKR